MIPFENLSYWEQKYLQNIDFTIIGSGIVGITTALSLRKRFPDAKIVMLERGYLPTGASTKNAGFACFGSPTEILEDLQELGEDKVVELIRMRYNGLQQLQQWVNPGDMNLVLDGTHELFTATEENIYKQSLAELSNLNTLIEKATGCKDCFEDAPHVTGQFGAIQHAICNQYEGRLHTGKMMQHLVHLCCEQDILILNGVEVKEVQSYAHHCTLDTLYGALHCSYCLVTNNGFAQQILPEISVQPARAQVLITKPFEKLPFEGAYHMHRGFFYARTIENRLLIGGGRHLDIPGETTTDLHTSLNIQEAIEEVLYEALLPTNTSIAIDHRWAGIMGVSDDRFPIIEAKGRCLIGVKMGGMGIAIGSWIGKKLAAMV